MKTTPLFLVAAALIAGGCQSTQTSSVPAKADNVAVNFFEADKFTDVRESFGASPSQDYLNQLSAHLQRVASPRLPAGQKLTVTFTDIDLAGDFQPTRVNLQDVRIVKEIYLPRMALNFKVTDADGNVVKEGQRKLTDLNFMNNLGLVERDLPLFYDKALLSNWVEQELRS